MKYQRKEQNYNSKRHRALFRDFGASTWDKSSRQGFITDRHVERKIILKMDIFITAVQFSAGERLSSISSPDRSWGPPSLMYNGHSTSFLVRKPKTTWSWPTYSPSSNTVMELLVRSNEYTTWQHSLNVEEKIVCWLNWLINNRIKQYGLDSEASS